MPQSALRYSLGETVVLPWTVLDEDDNPLTGVTSPAGITFTLHRVSAGALVASGETVNWAEVAGSPGHYGISFTPATVGIYTLQLKELAAGSQLRTQAFRDIEVAAAGAVFSGNFDNAYCSQSDVERWAQLSFTISSKPTAAQVAAFAELRASEITGVVASKGFTVTPLTVEAGSVEEDMLRDANALAAAGDSMLAKYMQESPSRTFKVSNIYDEYRRRLERLVEYLRSQKTPQRSMRTHISSGEVTLPVETPIEDRGFRDAITMDEEY